MGGIAHIVIVPQILPPAFAGIAALHGVVPRYAPDWYESLVPEKTWAPAGELSTLITHTGPL